MYSIANYGERQHQRLPLCPYLLHCVLFSTGLGGKRHPPKGINPKVALFATQNLFLKTSTRLTVA